MKKLILLCFFSFLSINIRAQQANSTKYKIATVAFYNLENLFDTENDPETFDDDRTPTGADKWTKEKYQDKLKNMAHVISQIGKEVTGFAPAVIGVCEIENRKVLEDLISQPTLAAYNYGIIQYDSPDRRGIDVAFLYQKEVFLPINSEAHELFIFDKEKERIYTRDQLVISGFLDGEEMYFLVNHWPSRFGGEKRSSFKRNLAAALNKKIIDSIQIKNPYAKIITMGDFNDNPEDESLKDILEVKNSKKNLQLGDLYNPMATLAEKGVGASAYRDNWSLFDQIILSEAFLKKEYSSFQFYQAHVFSKDFLITPSGKYKGYPFRSYGYEGYTGGYSDHFPVYVYLIKKIP